MLFPSEFSKHLTTSLLLISIKSFAGFLPQSFKAKYEEVHKHSLSGKITKTYGELNYQYPKRIKLISGTGSDQTTFVSNKVKSWYYTPPFLKGEKGTVRIEKANQVILSGLFDILKQGLKNNSDYRVRKKSKMKYVLEFNNKVQKEIGIVKALMVFKKSKSIRLTDIRNLLVFYKDSKRVEFLFNEITAVSKFPRNHFSFQIPENTNIVEN